MPNPPTVLLRCEIERDCCKTGYTAATVSTVIRSLSESVMLLSYGGGCKTRNAACRSHTKAGAQAGYRDSFSWIYQLHVPYQISDMVFKQPVTVSPVLSRLFPWKIPFNGYGITCWSERSVKRQSSAGLIIGSVLSNRFPFTSPFVKVNVFRWRANTCSTPADEVSASLAGAGDLTQGTACLGRYHVTSALSTTVTKSRCLGYCATTASQA